MLKINEIFFSIQGESSLVGQPTVFVRTSGCHLRCHYCDTTYAYYDGKKWTEDEIIAKVKSYPARFVCLTGGEPLLQQASLQLMSRLCDLNYRVSLETSGDLSCTEVDSRVLKVVDIKTPDSGEANRFDQENLQLEPVNTEFKFVICSEKDFDWAEDFATKHALFKNFAVFYSPSFRVIEEKWLAKKILQSGSLARLQLQLHKYIWSPDLRGV